MPALSAEDKATLLPQLQAIRAPPVLERAAVALEALRLHTLEENEEAMDDAALAFYPHFVRDLQDYKLTFEHECPERAEEYDDIETFLQQAILVVEAMEAEAEGEPVPCLPDAA